MITIIDENGEYGWLSIKIKQLLLSSIRMGYYYYYWLEWVIIN